MSHHAMDFLNLASIAIGKMDCNLHANISPNVGIVSRLVLNAYPDIQHNSCS